MPSNASYASNAQILIGSEWTSSNSQKQNSSLRPPSILVWGGVGEIILEHRELRKLGLEIQSLNDLAIPGRGGTQRRGESKLWEGMGKKVWK